MSVSLGALVPASLFEMGHSHPVTSLSKQRYRGTNETKEGFLGPVRTYGVHSTHSDFPTSLLGVVGLVIDKLQPPSTRPVPSFIGRRLYLDISATPEGRRGAPPQLAEAVAAFVGRSGARVVTDVRAADWLVVSERSGDAYWHVSLSAPLGIRNSEARTTSLNSPPYFTGSPIPEQGHGHTPTSTCSPQPHRDRADRPSLGQCPLHVARNAEPAHHICAPSFTSHLEHALLPAALHRRPRGCLHPANLHLGSLP